MNEGQAIALGVALVAIMASAGVFALAWRRERVSRAVGTLDRRAKKLDRSRRPVSAADETPEGSVTVLEVAPAEAAEVEPPPPPFVEVSEEEFGSTRRQFLNRAIGASAGLYLTAIGITSLAFLWPKLSGGFGSKIDAGNVNELRDAIFQPDGSIEPFYVAAAKTYLVPFEEADVAGTDFEGLGVVAGGLAGLFQKCVHLGCRVPWCASSQGFECPCHGSKYNAHGEYEAGPAPRNLDRFPVEVNEQGRLIINTGAVVDTARAKVKTVNYPQGLSCL